MSGSWRPSTWSRTKWKAPSTATTIAPMPLGTGNDLFVVNWGGHFSRNCVRKVGEKRAPRGANFGSMGLLGHAQRRGASEIKRSYMQGSSRSTSTRRMLTRRRHIPWCGRGGTTRRG